MTPPPWTQSAYDRAAWQTFETTVRGLLEVSGFTDAGLDAVRVAMVRGMWRCDAGDLPDDVAAHRRVLLHDVCTALAQLRGLDAWLFPLELLPTMPDDLASLE